MKDVTNERIKKMKGKKMIERELAKKTKEGGCKEENRSSGDRQAPKGVIDIDKDGNERGGTKYGDDKPKVPSGASGK